MFYKLALAVSLFFLATAVLPASPAGQLEAAVKLCSAETADTARLSCYDRIASQLQGSRISDQKPAPDGASHETRAADQFGLSSAEVLRRQAGPGSAQKSVKHLSARVVSLSIHAGGQLSLRLDNGQVWEQTEDGPDLHLGQGDVVIIDRGMLGAFWLSAGSGNHTLKVRRVE